MENIQIYFENQFKMLSENSGAIVWNTLCIIFIVIAGKAILSLISRMTSYNMKKAEEKPEMQKKRIKTLMTLLRSVARYAVYFICAMLILSVLGFGTTLHNLLVTAGIGSVALGFGAQSLVKDVVTGFFLMFENQFSVGDFVKIGDVEGTVSATAMRVTYLKTAAGQQIIIPNGKIETVINYSRADSLAKVQIPLSYEGDLKKAMDVCLKAAEKCAKEHSDLVLEQPKMLGITAFEDSSIAVTLICKVKTLKHWEMERALRLSIKEALDANQIEIPFNQLDVTIKTKENQNETAE